MKAEQIIKLTEEADKVDLKTAEVLWETANEIFRQLSDTEKAPAMLYMSDLFVLIEEKRKKEKENRGT